MSRTKVRLSPGAISDKWGRRIKAATPDIIAGVEAVTESPAMKAVAKVDKMRANLNKSLDEGVWQKRLSEVTLAEWKTKTASKVRERLAGGVDASMPKRQKFDGWLAGRLNGVLPEIADMPDLTLEDSFARVRRLMEHMAGERYKAVT